MKKFTAILLSALLPCSLAACSSSEQSNGTNSVSSEPQSSFFSPEIVDNGAECAGQSAENSEGMEDSSDNKGQSTGSNEDAQDPTETSGGIS